MTSNSIYMNNQDKRHVCG